MPALPSSDGALRLIVLGSRPSALVGRLEADLGVAGLRWRSARGLGKATGPARVVLVESLLGEGLLPVLDRGQAGRSTCIITYGDPIELRRLLSYSIADVAFLPIELDRARRILSGTPGGELRGRVRVDWPGTLRVALQVLLARVDWPSPSRPPPASVSALSVLSGCSRPHLSRLASSNRVNLPRTLDLARARWFLWLRVIMRVEEPLLVRALGFSGRKGLERMLRRSLGGSRVDLEAAERALSLLEHALRPALA